MKTQTKRAIFKSVLLLFLLIKGTISFGQNLSGIKSITKLENGHLRNYQLFDSNGKVIFWKEQQDIVLMMGANYYNTQHKRIKTISGHSNVGFTVWEYTLDSAGHDIEIYAYKEVSNNNHTLNPYNYIEKYSAAEDLASDSTILRMIKSNERYKVFKKTYDYKGNELSSTLYEEDGTDSTTNFKIYDNANNVVKFEYRGDIGKWDIFYKYDKNNNLLSSIRIIPNGDTTELHQYKYDKNNNRIEDKYFSRGKLNYIEKKIYFNGSCIEELFYNSDGKLEVKDAYKYDKKQNVVKQITEDYRVNTTRTFNWEYRYY